MNDHLPIQAYPRLFHCCTPELSSWWSILWIHQTIIMLTNNALYPWGTSIGKDKHSLSIGLSIDSAKFKHERNAIMQHQPVFKLHPVRLPVELPLAQCGTRLCHMTRSASRSQQNVYSVTTPGDRLCLHSI